MLVEVPCVCEFVVVVCSSTLIVTVSRRVDSKGEVVDLRKVCLAEVSVIVVVVVVKLPSVLDVSSVNVAGLDGGVAEAELVATA